MLTNPTFLNYLSLVFMMSHFSDFPPNLFGYFLICSSKILLLLQGSTSFLAYSLYNILPGCSQFLWSFNYHPHTVISLSSAQTTLLNFRSLQLITYYTSLHYMAHTTHLNVFRIKLHCSNNNCLDKKTILSLFSSLQHKKAG